MKKLVGMTVIAAMLVVSLISLFGCGDTSQKHMADAKENMQEAGQDLDEAAMAAREETKAKATADWQQFKHESDSTIADMEKQIKVLNERIAKEDKVAREKLTGDLKQVEARLNAQKEKLRQESLAFEAELKEFDDEVAANRDIIKREFKHDMEEIGTAIKDLFKDNVK